MFCLQHPRVAHTTHSDQKLGCSIQCTEQSNCCSVDYQDFHQTLSGYYIWEYICFSCFVAQEWLNWNMKKDIIQFIRLSQLTMERVQHFLAIYFYSNLIIVFSQKLNYSMLYYYGRKLEVMRILLWSSDGCQYF